MKSFARNSHLASAAAAIMLGLGMVGGMPVVQQTRDLAQTLVGGGGKTMRVGDMTGTAQQLHRAGVDKFVRAGIGMGRRGPPAWPGLGWSVATDRRRARKARNVKRNRRAHK